MSMTLDPDLSRYRKLLVYGGSFDPPQLAHVELPRAVRLAVGADVTLYIPAARPPHKLGRRQSSAAHRLAMLRLALAGRDDALILTDELDRAADGRPSYTIDTLEALRRRIAPHAELRLLIGADQVGDFQMWRRPERIMKIAEPLVMLRPPPPPAPPDLSPPWRQRVVRVDTSTLSSTEVRRRVAAREPIDALVHPDVARYIAEHGLYRSQTHE